jgi:cobalt transporter subunit CbtB
MTASIQVATQSRSELLGIILVLVAGLSLVGVAGFAGSDVLHAIAHDGRHSAAFPCH